MVWLMLDRHSVFKLGFAKFVVGIHKNRYNRFQCFHTNVNRLRDIPVGGDAHIAPCFGKLHQILGPMWASDPTGISLNLLTLVSILRKNIGCAVQAPKCSVVDLHYCFQYYACRSYPMHSACVCLKSQHPDSIARHPCNNSAPPATYPSCSVCVRLLRNYPQQTL